MNKKAIEEFYINDCIPIFSELYREIKIDIKNRETGIKKQWIETFDQIFRKMAQCQKEKSVEAISHIHIVYLRTRLLQKDYRYAIYAYGKEWYMGREMIIGNLDVSMFFLPFDTAWRRLEKETLKYIQKVTPIDVERLMLEESGRMILFAVSLLRKWRRELRQTEGFRMLKKESFFHIQVGEYYEPGYVLFTQIKEKEERKIKKALWKKKNHCGYDLRNMQLDGMEYAGMEFMDADFTGSSMRNCIFHACILQGAVMEQCTLTEAVFIDSAMEESEWKDSDLRDARFEECLFYEGEIPNKGVFMPDYGNISFQNCRLEGTKFIHCAMNGADFTETDVSGCDFTDSLLAGCRFRKGQTIQLNLSEIQRRQIIEIE